MNRGGGSDENSGSLLMSLIPNDYHKPDLFLFYRNDEDDNPIDVTNYKIDDFNNLSIELDKNLTIECLYENSNLSPTIVSRILFGLDPSDDIVLSIKSISDGPVIINQVNYNNKNYYSYFKKLS